MKKILIVIIMCIATSAYALPEAVDNSTSEYFPAIKNQGIGWCGLFHMIYYNLSYTWSKANKEVKIFSPRLAWGELDFGTGVDLYESFMFMKDHGTPEWNVVQEEVYPWIKKIPQDKYPVVWNNAAKYKVRDIEYIKLRQHDPCTVPEAIQKVKERLAEGHVLTFGTYFYSWKTRLIEDNSDSTLDDTEVGKKIIYWNYKSAGQHGMTVVGYNDTLWADCNNNDIIDEGELGAFRVANSHGPEWGDSGYVWMAYDALFDDSRVEGASVSKTYRFGAIFTAFHRLVLSELEPEPEPEPIDLEVRGWNDALDKVKLVIDGMYK